MAAEPGASEPGRVAHEASRISSGTSEPDSALAPTILHPRLTAPPCEGISAYIISVFEDPKDSRATLSTDPNDQGVRRRVGQLFGDHRVIAIDYNPRRMSSAVWLARGREVCQVLLRRDHPVRERQKALARKRAREAKKKKSREARRKRRAARRKKKKK